MVLTTLSDLEPPSETRLLRAASHRFDIRLKYDERAPRAVPRCPWLSRTICQLLRLGNRRLRQPLQPEKGIDDIIAVYAVVVPHHFEQPEPNFARLGSSFY